MTHRRWLASLKQTIAAANNLHRPDGRPNVFLFSAPRGGSTWLTELIATQPGFKPCDEPFNLRTPAVAHELARLGIYRWNDLYDGRPEASMHAYVRAIVDGSSGHMNPFFYRNHFRLVTHRIVFKILHAGEDRINWFRDHFDGRVVLLLRHPIPVTLTRKSLPRLRAFIDTSYSQSLSEEQRRLARHLTETGSDREKGMLDWCLQHAIPLRDATDDWTIVTYEQLVLDPATVIAHLAERLELPRPEAMMRRLREPSSSTHQSDAMSQEVLRGHQPDRGRWLVEKWRTKVSDSEEKQLMDILAAFGIDVYEAGRPLPTDRFWLSPRSG
jgi:LPS sulfotransferase NodH